MAESKESEPKPSEPTKTEIWKEVERRFEHPPAEFLKTIENEVEKRVTARVKQYKTLAWVVGTAIVMFATVFWKISLSEVSKEIERLLSETEASKAKDRIVALRSNAEEQGRGLDRILDTVKNQETDFTSRLTQIKATDNIVLKDDLRNQYVFQVVTNLDGTRILLDYPAESDTIRFVYLGEKREPFEGLMVFEPLQGCSWESTPATFVNIASDDLVKLWSERIKKREMIVTYAKASKSH